VEIGPLGVGHGCALPFATMQRPDTPRPTPCRALSQWLLPPLAALVALCLFALPAAAEGRLFPDGTLYPPHVASELRPGFGLVLFAADSGVEEAGSPRFGLRLGGRFGLVRWTPEIGDDGVRRGGPPVPLQLDLDAGFRGQFDVENSLDNIGWDGNYGLTLSADLGDGWALRGGLYHTSSHVGDEYSEKTGRQRIGYTREEVIAGVSWVRSASWRYYLEGGWSYNSDDNELRQPGRLEVGAEWRGDPRFVAGRAGWFAALDVAAFEESDWSPDLTLHAGLAFAGDGREWRVGIVWYDGRNPIGEFFQAEESYVGLGLWLDV